MKHYYFLPLLAISLLVSGCTDEEFNSSESPVEPSRSHQTPEADDVPVLSLKSQDKTITILLRGETEVYTVADLDGKVLAEAIPLSDLQSLFPREADKIAGGLADLRAANDLKSEPHSPMIPAETIRAREQTPSVTRRLFP